MLPRDLERAFRQIGLVEAGNDISGIIENITHSENGKIQYSDFLLATINFKEKLSEYMLFDTFKHFDIENKGYISKENLSQALQKSGSPVTSSELDVIMGEVDIKNWGQIDFSDFKKMMLADLSPRKSPYPPNMDKYSTAFIQTMKYK